MSIDIPKLDSIDWALDAKHFISVLNSFTAQDSAMVFLRHSQRTEPKIWDEIMRAPLTQEGIEVAEEFGSSLPLDRTYRLYHSRVDRCRQTVDAINVGFQKALDYRNITTARMSIGGYLPVLTEFYMQTKKFQEYTQRDGLKFVRNWLANHYSPDDSETAITYAQRAAHDLLTIHFNRKTPVTDIFISHDFNILVLRSLWTGIFPDGDWISYLGGFILKLGEKKMTIYYNQTQEDIYYPHWWQAITGLAF